MHGNRVTKPGYGLTKTTSRSPVEIGLKALGYSFGGARVTITLTMAERDYAGRGVDSPNAAGRSGGELK
jgi:hypothetical protein